MILEKQRVINLFENHFICDMMVKITIQHLVDLSIILHHTGSFDNNHFLKENQQATLSVLIISK